MRVPSFLAVLLLVGAPGLGDEPPLTNEDIVRLTRSGLPASVILLKIETTATAFDASVDALVRLAKARVAPEVVRVMTRVAAGLPAEPPEPVESEPDTPEVREETALVELEPDAPEAREVVAPQDLDLPEGGACGGGLALLLEGGALSRLDRHEVDGVAEVDTRIPGLRSVARTGQRRPTFFFCVPDAGLESSDVYGLAGFSLIRLGREGGDRIGVEATSEWISSRDEVAPGVFQVESGEEFGPGEYAVHMYLGDAVWTFGIDE